MPRPSVRPAGDPPFVERGSPAYRNIGFALFLAGFATLSLIYCVQPLLPLLAADFAVGPAKSSLALSLTTGCLAFAIFAAAALSERFGRRELMFASIALAAGLSIAAALVPGWLLFLVIRSLEGLAIGGVPAVAIAYLAEEIAPSDLGFAMGLYIAGTAFGGMAGRVLTGFLAEFISWRAAVGAIGGLGLAAASGFVLLLPPSRRFASKAGFDLGFHLKAWASHFGGGGEPFLFAISFCAMGSFVAIYNYAGFRLMRPPYELGPTATGLIFIVYICGMVASSLGGAAADRLGRTPVLAVALALMAAGIAVTLLPALAAIIVGIGLLTGGFFAAHAVASGWVGRLGGASKGHAASLYMLAYYLGSSIAGSAGGWFWAEGGWPAVAGFTLALLLAAGLCTLALARIHERGR